MARSPLKSSDDGSGNRYPVRAKTHDESYEEDAREAVQTDPTDLHVIDNHGPITGEYWEACRKCFPVQTDEDGFEPYEGEDVRVATCDLCGDSSDHEHDPSEYEPECHCPDACYASTHPQDDDQSPLATEPSYDLRLDVDGEELLLPCRVYAGKDYELGEPLDGIAWRQASSVLHLLPSYTEDVRARLYPVPALDCTGDWNPEPVGEGVAD